MALTLRAEYTRSAQMVWGISAPIPALAAQVHQESAWRPDVCSPFACGLTQFTPQTADWMQRTYGVELGPGGRMDARWSIRAQHRYMRALWDGTTGARTECDRFAFALRAYNGGPGWIARDRALAARSGADAGDWRSVQPFNAGRAPQFHRENTEYPVRILDRHQALYAAWGRMICRG